MSCFFEDPVELGTVIFREAYGHHLWGEGFRELKIIWIGT